MILTNFLIDMSSPIIIAIALLIVVVLVALIASKVNTRMQMRVSLLMDDECDIYTKDGIRKYLQKNKKKFNKPVILVIDIKNLAYLYNNSISNKHTMMVDITNCMLKGLLPIETIGRFSYNKFIIALSDKDRDQVKAYCKQVEERLSLIKIENYGSYNFILEFGINDVTGLDDPDKAIMAAISVFEFSNKKEANILYYSDSVSSSMSKYDAINSMKDDALEDEQFKIYIQPKVDFRTGEVIGGEALCRWLDNDGNILYNPGEFIPIFENNGFIKKLDMEMFRQSCELLQTLRGRGRNNIIISVNVSKVNFESKTFIDELEDMVARYSIDPSAIEIEITESASMMNSSNLSQCIMKLRNRGFRLSMDDFGKEYSSLGSLVNNPFEVIKMDMVFFRNDLATDKEKYIVKNIINLLRQLNVKIVCEGVGNQKCLDSLAEISRDVIIQGYVFSQPLPINQFEAFLDTKFEFNYPEPKETIEVVKPAQTKEEHDNINEQINVLREELVNDEAPATSAEEQSELEALRAELEALKNQAKPKQKTEIELLREELEKVKQEAIDAEKRREEEKRQLEIDALKREIEALKSNRANNNSIDIDALATAISSKVNQDNDELDAMEAENDHLASQLEQAEAEKEELKRLLEEMGSSDDDDDEDSMDEEYSPKYGLKEAQFIISSYKNTYGDDWLPKCKEELGDNYPELIKSLKYYGGNVKLNFVDKLYEASPEVKSLYNRLKNEFMKYEKMENKTLKGYDSFYYKRQQIGKMTLTKTKVKLFLCADPNQYSGGHIPFSNVADKKAHEKTPMMMMIKSHLSIKRAASIIDDVMTAKGATVDENYQDKDYTIR